MSVTVTDKLGLSLPDQTEDYSVDLYNANFQAIDNAFKQVNDEVLDTVNENLDVINKKLQNFEEAKRTLVSSPLGQALKLTYNEEDPEGSTKWDEMVDAISRVPDYGKYDYNGTSTVTLPPGYYSGGTIDCSAAYQQGKRDALKTSGGIQMYPAANGVKWSGSASANAGNASTTSSASASCVTSEMVDLTNVKSITAIFSAYIGPVNQGSKRTTWGNGSASLVVTRGSGATASGSTSFSTGSSNKAIVVDVSGLSGNYLVQVNTYAFAGSTTNTAGRTWGSSSNVTMTSCNAGA